MDNVPLRSPRLSARRCRELRPDGPHVTLVLVGEIDISNAHDVGTVLVDTVHLHRPRCLHVDLGGVTFLGAAGARALAVGRAHAVRAGCALRVVRPNRLVHRVLELYASIDDDVLAHPGGQSHRGEL